MSLRYFKVTFALSVAFSALTQTAAAATLCVSQKPASGCAYSTIGAAVAAASPNDVIQVMQGTYREDIEITQGVSLVGANRSNTIIDATALPTGIYIHDTAGVFVSGFTVENANYEGILVKDSSNVTITGSHVLNNNLSLDISTFECPGIPPFETAEGFDCGEGIHLSGVDHSIVSNNFIEHNAGGILLSDDTGATHDNLILNNTVQENPFDCGITLASHPLYMGGPTAAGVFHNTITGNTSTHNGFQVPGAGAGIGLFSPAPFTKTYGNVLVNNTLKDNGLPGVAMHGHSPGAGLADNMIVGNQISGNGADTEDTFTSGPTGINVSGGDDGMGSPVDVIPGTIIAGNVISQESIGVAAKTNSLVAVHLNNFINDVTGVDNLAGGLVGAKLNWWGCSGGPTSPGCAGVHGNNILYVPFLTSPSNPSK